MRIACAAGQKIDYSSQNAKPFLGDTNEFNWRCCSGRLLRCAANAKHLGPASAGLFFGARTSGSTGKRRGARQNNRRAPIPAPNSRGHKAPAPWRKWAEAENPAGGDRRGLRSHDSDSGGSGGSGAVQLAIIISHARAGKVQPICKFSGGLFGQRLTSFARL
jgi:hypothetical protein